MPCQMTAIRGDLDSLPAASWRARRHARDQEEGAQETEVRQGECPPTELSEEEQPRDGLAEEEQAGEGLAEGLAGEGLAEGLAGEGLAEGLTGKGLAEELELQLGASTLSGRGRGGRDNTTCST